ncbi:MAG: glycoside hydrolase family 1 protein [Actinomycetota bacterium]
MDANRTLTFPDGFLWGAATSAHQIEGGNSNSDWWEHERAPGTNAQEPSGLACDSYNRFGEDWALAASSGMNAVRFSIEWARIEPSPGEFSTAALDHYRDVIGTARDRGLTTSVTLHHFTNPLWFARGGGWDSAEAPEAFARYAKTASSALGDLLQIVNTINEPSVLAVVGHVMGYFPPRIQDIPTSHRVTVNLLRAHAAAAEQIHAGSDAQAGLALSVMEYVPIEDTPAGRRARDYMRHWWAGAWIDAVRDGRTTGLEIPDEEIHGLKAASDFVGIQYYTCLMVGTGAEGGASARLPEQAPIPDIPEDVRTGARRTQMHWAWHPEGFGRVIDEVAEAGLPMYITENGIATADDGERVEFVDLHLRQVHAAIERGRDVRGYFYWSLLDNFEWNEGYGPTFGLIAVDRSTMERSPKPSLSWYGNVARANALG